MTYDEFEATCADTRRRVTKSLEAEIRRAAHVGERERVSLTFAGNYGTTCRWIVSGSPSVVRRMAEFMKNSYNMRSNPRPDLTDIVNVEESGRVTLYIFLERDSPRLI